MTAPADIALKAAMLHPHFESIHPFEDGNGRVGRALVAKTIAKGLGLPLVLPVSTIIARHRAAYYDEIKVSKPTATRDLGELMAQGAIVPEGLGGPEARYRLNTSLREPIDPLNDPLKVSLEERILLVVARHSGVNLPYLASVESSPSRATVKRAIAALVKAGKIEHRGSKKTGGYYLAEKK